MHLLGDVGRGHVNDDLPLLTEGWRKHSLGQDPGDEGGDEGFLEVDVDETWSCNIHLVKMIKML